MIRSNHKSTIPRLCLTVLPFPRRAKLLAMLICSVAAALSPQVMAATWPVAGDEIVTSSFGDNEKDKIHGGIDIPAQEDTLVRAVGGGKILAILFRNPDGSRTQSQNPLDVGKDVFEILTDDGNNPFLGLHSYGHIKPLAGKDLVVGQVLTEGVDFARIRGSDAAFGGTFDHLHYGFSRSSVKAPAVLPATFIDPLQNVFPLETVSEVVDTRHITYASISSPGIFADFGQDDSPRAKKRFVKGGVTMISEMIVDMGDQQFVEELTDPRGTGLTLFKGITAVPTAISYEVDKPAYLPRGDIAERTLVRFDQTKSVHDNQVATIYDHARNVTPDMENSYNYNYIITHTDGTGPSAPNFWKTDASKTGAGTLGDGSARGTATTNAAGAFPDGLFEVTPLAANLAGSRGGRVYAVLVNNWNQTAEPAKAAGEVPATGGSSTESNPSQEKKNAPPPREVFELGDDLFVKGSEYVDDQTYQAFVFPFKSVWNQDDPLVGFISSASVKSDFSGDVLGQLLWADIDRTGDFNVVIDYDNDGLFSWTLDGLGSLEVVPEPSSLTMLAFGGLLLARWRRRIR